MKTAELAKVKEAGIAGGGGAGFPAWKKLERQAEWLIINGAECEPFLQSDQYLMRRQAEELVQGMLAAAQIIGALKKTIAIKRTYVQEEAALKEAIARSGADIAIKLLEPVYPAGDEQVTVHGVTGRIVPPGGLPLDVGCVVISVSTAVAIAQAQKGQPSIARIVTVGGYVKQPQILQAPIGTAVSQLIAAAGGATCATPRVIMGGPMMGRLLETEATAPEAAARQAAAPQVITKTDSGILVLPPNHPLVQSREQSVEHMRKRARSACVQCRMCTDLCPRFVLGHAIEPHKVMRAVAYSDFRRELVAGALLCSECGLCEVFSCPMGLSPRRINIWMKGLLREAKASPCKELKRREAGDVIGVSARRLAIRAGLGRCISARSESCGEVVPRQVVIPLKQHTGAPCVPSVTVGETVQEGQCIGTVPPDALGVPVHASIGGLVTAVNHCITIEREGSS